MFIFNLFSAAFCSELQFLACLILRFLILNLIRLQDAWTAYDRRTETKEERKKTRTTKQNPRARPVVQKPINANPRLRINQGVHFSTPKCCSTLIFGETLHYKK